MRSAQFASLAALVLILALLPGCATTLGGQKPVVVERDRPLPPVPDDIRACFAGVVDLPPGAWSAEVAGKLLAKVRSSEVSKTKCGQRFVEWYEDLARSRAPGSQ